MRIPPELLPRDGRFGSGPSKVPAAALDRLASSTRMGTSHRKPPVKTLVNRIQVGLANLYGLPDGYEVVLGNGGSTAFWDIATFCLVEKKAAHASFGEFSAKFAAATNAAPFLEASEVATAPAGSLATPPTGTGADVYAWPHNETSTGVAAPVVRPDGEALTVVDGTSAAGALTIDPAQVDAYYFAPQKALAADGGLWLALLSPAAVERAERIKASGRWIPEFLSLPTAITNSRANQTLNTPAIATLELIAAQLDVLEGSGGLPAAESRCRESSAHLYAWAEASEFATPFVQDPAHRSPVVATIDLDGVDANAVVAALAENGVVDTFAYRKLGRNQLRMGVFPAVDPEDVRALTACIDYVAERL